MWVCGLDLSVSRYIPMINSCKHEQLRFSNSPGNFETSWVASAERGSIKSCTGQNTILEDVTSVRESALHASGLIIMTLSQCTASCPRIEVLLVTTVLLQSTAVSSTRQFILMQLQLRIFLFIGILTLFVAVMSNSRTVFSSPLAARGCRENKEG